MPDDKPIRASVDKRICEGKAYIQFDRVIIEWREVQGGWQHSRIILDADSAHELGRLLMTGAMALNSKEDPQ